MTSDHDHVPHDALVALHQLQVASSRVVSRVAAELGMIAPDLRALYLVSVTPDSTPTVVADHLGLTTGSVTSLLDRLERAGLATRRPHPRDRRSVTLALTPRGTEVIDRVNERYGQALSATVSADDIPEVTRSLLAISDALSRLDEDAI